MEVNGMRIRELRLDAGLSQAELAELAHTTRQGISMIERGRRNPQPRTTRRLAEALGTTVAEIRKRPQ
jgi:transcriptional regulator with XRE-family HTH domain